MPSLWRTMAPFDTLLASLLVQPRRILISLYSSVCGSKGITGVAGVGEDGSEGVGSFVCHVRTQPLQVAPVQAEYVQRFPLEIQIAAALPHKNQKTREQLLSPGVAVRPVQDISSPCSRTGARARCLCKFVARWQQERVETETFLAVAAVHSLPRCHAGGFLAPRPPDSPHCVLRTIVLALSARPPISYVVCAWLPCRNAATSLIKMEHGAPVVSNLQKTPIFCVDEHR